MSINTLETKSKKCTIDVMFRSSFHEVFVVVVWCWTTEYIEKISRSPPQTHDMIPLQATYSLLRQKEAVPWIKVIRCMIFFLCVSAGSNCVASKKQWCLKSIMKTKAFQLAEMSRKVVPQWTQLRSNTSLLSQGVVESVGSSQVRCPRSLGLLWKQLVTVDYMYFLCVAVFLVCVGVC